MSGGKKIALRLVGMGLVLAAAFTVAKPGVAQVLRAAEVAASAKIKTMLGMRHRVENAQVTQKAFGYKTGWIAVRSTDRDAVVRALGLKGERRQEWPQGLSEAYDSKSRRVAVTPSVNGWILIVGTRFLEDSFAEPRQRARLHERIANLSKEFGEALLFATYRVSDIHAWGRWQNGELQRLVSFSDDGLEQSGTADEEEGKMLKPDEDGFVFLDEEKVMRIAAAWSISPTQLDDLDGDPLKGADLITGSLP